MDITYASAKALYLILLLSAIPVIVATLVGLFIGLIQTVTQIQEQTLPFGLKLLSVFICLIIMFDWLSEKMLSYSIEMIAIALKNGI